MPATPARAVRRPGSPPREPLRPRSAAWRRRALGCGVALGLWCAGGAAAQAPAPAPAADRPAPSLEVEGDAPIPYHAFAVYADPVAAVLGTLRLSIEGAIGRHHSVRVSPEVIPGGDASALGLDAAYHLWPFGRGTRLLHVGPVAGVGAATGTQAERLFAWAGVEAGFAWVWEGLFLSFTGGAHAVWDEGGRVAVAPRARFGLGWSWM